MRRFTLPMAAAVAVIAVAVVLVGFVGLSGRSNAVIEGTPIAISGSGAQVVDLRATEMQFAPNAIVVRAGQPIELTLENQGKSVHDFTLSDGVSSPVKVLAQPGQSGTATFTFGQPGTYTFICSQPFHQAQGMRGTFIAR